MLDWCKKGGPRGYVTTRDIYWWIGKKDSGWELVIPAGTAFESSVPRALQWLWSPDDPCFLKAAVIHDTLLERGYRHAFADSQWVEAALSVDAPPIKTRIGYLLIVARRMMITLPRQRRVFLSSE